MNNKDQNTYYLYPSTLFASNKKVYVKTLLGSCVAVCLYDSKIKAGGMTHYMLPFWNGDGLATPKYGNYAIEQLIKKILSYGSHKNNLKAKVFGGASVLSQNNNLFKIGQRNIDIAKYILDNNNIPIISSSVGGTLGRRIIFNTESSEVKQYMLKKSKTQKNRKL